MFLDFCFDIFLAVVETEIVMELSEIRGKSCFSLPLQCFRLWDSRGGKA